MTLVAKLVVSLIAALHVYILVLEMFLSETRRAGKALGLTPEFAAATKVLVALI